METNTNTTGDLKESFILALKSITNPDSDSASNRMAAVLRMLLIDYIDRLESNHNFDMSIKSILSNIDTTAKAEIVAWRKALNYEHTEGVFRAILNARFFQVSGSIPFSAEKLKLYHAAYEHYFGLIVIEAYYREIRKSPTCCTSDAILTDLDVWLSNTICVLGQNIEQCVNN